MAGSEQRASLDSGKTLAVTTDYTRRNSRKLQGQSGLIETNGARHTNIWLRLSHYELKTNEIAQAQLSAKLTGMV